MSPTWHSQDLPEARPISPAGWMRVGLRGVAIAIIFVCGLVIHVPLRMVELALTEPRRPLTGRLAQGVYRLTLLCLGLPLRIEDAAGRGAQDTPAALVANHASWLDIVVLNAAQPVTFVSKSEVADWPGIGALARLAGTVFITRNPRDASAQQRQLAQALAQGRQLVLFPEGTSTDGQRVLPFKSTLMSAFYHDPALQAARVQPVTIIYDAPADVAEPRFYGWWGDMDLGPHLLRVLAQAPQGRVTVRRHTPVPVAEAKDRKTLSARLEHAVRDGMPRDRQRSA